MEASSSSSKSKTSSDHPRYLKHMRGHDIFKFGASEEMPTICLPTYRVILKHYFFLSDRAKESNKMFSYKAFTSEVVDKIIEIWSKLNIDFHKRQHIYNKLNSFIERYRKETRDRNKSQTFEPFVDSTKKLFYIGLCKCALQTTQCSCGKIPAHLKEFMFDQHNERKLTIPESEENTTEIGYDDNSDNDPLFQDPEITCHIQATETHVELCTAVSKRITHTHRQGAVMGVTLKSRAEMAKIESKQDLKRMRMK